MALRHEKRLLQKSHINLGREGCSQAVNFPEVRNEIVALKKLEQEQKEVAVRIAQLEEGIKQIEAQRQENAKEQSAALGKLETVKKPVLQRRNELKTASDLCDGELKGVDRRLAAFDASDRELLQQIAALQARFRPRQIWRRKLLELVRAVRVCRTNARSWRGLDSAAPMPAVWPGKN